MFYLRKKQDDEETNFIDGMSNFFSNNFMKSNQLKTDIIDDEYRYVIYVDVPGIKKEHISIVVEENYLTIQTLPCDREDNREYIKKERRFDTVSRKFHLENIEEDGITAKKIDGILQIIIPKKTTEMMSKKSIPIE